MLSCPGLRIALVTYFLTEKIALVLPRKKEKKKSETVYALETGLQAVVAGSIRQLDRGDWERSVPAADFFMRWDFLEAFENTAASNLQFRYVQLYKGSKPVAAFYFQVIHLTAEEIGYILKPLAEGEKPASFTSQWTEWFRRTREERGFRLLVAGNNFISGEYAVGMSASADSRQVYESLSETAKRIARTERFPAKISAILVKDFFSKGKIIPADRLKKKRFHRFKVEPEMIVPLDPKWKVFGDYASAMSKKYRNRLKSVYRTSEKLELVEFDEKQTEKYAAEIYKLYYNVHERAKFRLAALGENYFTEMKKTFPEEFRITGYFLGKELVAFRSSFQLKTHLEAHFIGLNYTLNPELHLYQRMLYDFVAEGIEAKTKSVYLGRTAAEMKSTVGAVAHDLVCYIRHRNSLSNQVIRPFIDYLQPSEWIPRNPFKETELLREDAVGEEAKTFGS